MATDPASHPHGGELVEFVLPGLLHGLGNALFSIQGFAQLLGKKSDDVEKQRGAILEASERARAALLVFQQISGEAPSDAPGEPAGATLHRLAEFLSVPLRDHGLRLTVAPPVDRGMMSVNGAVLSCAVVEVMRHLVDCVATGFEGVVGIDVAAQSRDEVVIAIRVDASPTQLPFPIDLGSVAARAREMLQHLGVTLDRVSDGSTLRLQLPAS